MIVCLHGFMDTPRTWDLVRPALERDDDVLAPALDYDDPAGAVERALDEAGIELAAVVGNSLGGYVALELAARGRARGVVAFAPAGGWAPGDESWRDTLALQRELHAATRAAAPHADAIAATPEGRRRATRYLTTSYEHIPPDLIADQLRATAATDAGPLIDRALRDGWPLDTARVTCPVRVVWGTEDRLLPWPSAAARYRRELPRADWVELDGVGHCPQLDVPLEAAELIRGFVPCL